MDELDYLNERAEFYELARKAAHAAKLKPDAIGTGSCLCCGAKLEGGRRWCDADCRDEWQFLRNRKGQS